MTDRWERLTDLYHAAVALPDDERASLLTEECADDPELLADVERLVAAHDRVSRPVAPPPAAEFAHPAPAPVFERPAPTPPPPPVAPPASDRCGPYRLLKEIGRGRLGVVHMAVRDDGRFDQRVAIEVVEPAADIDAALDGLRAAYQVLASHDHPTIARLIAVSATDDGRPYLVTEYVEGDPIDSFADDRRLSVAERLQLFMKVCNAVAYVHRCGVTHGALQPATILVTASGLPKLFAFGTAGRATTDDDIRSLGALLELLLLGSDANGRRGLRDDLDTIVRTALREDLGRRYESVDEMADDVRRVFDELTTRTRPEGRRERPAPGRGRRSAAALAWVAAGIAIAALGMTAAPLFERPATPAAVAPRIDAPAPRQIVLVSDFADHTGSPPLVVALSDAFRTGLTESPSVVITSARRRRPNVEITGSVDSVGRGYSIMVRVSRPENADSAPTLVETATDSADVMPALNRLSARLREQLGESQASIASTPRLDQVTSASLAAVRAFTNATRAIAGGDRAGGVRLLRSAVTIDTGFAAAHRLLSVTHAELGQRERSVEALDHAIANQDRLPYYTRYHTVANHAMTLLAHYAAAIDAYNKVLERYPEDVRALEGLGRAHAARREYAVQESLLVRAIAADPDTPSLYSSLTTSLINQGKYDEARKALDRAEARFPGMRANDLAAISLAASNMNWEEAERAASGRPVQTSGDPVDAVDGLETLASIRMTQGRVGEAERDLRRVVAAGSRGGNARRALMASVRLAYLDLRYHRSQSAALATMNSALTRFPLSRMPESERPYDEVARLYADAGRPGRALELIAQSARTRIGRQRVADANRRWTLGAIATAEGRAWEGEIEINGAAETHPCPICALPDLARAYEVAGKPDSAIATYERYLRTPWQRRYETDATELGYAMERLGGLYQQQKDDAKAAALYGTLLQLWRGADPELQPLIADVRRRLEQTGGAAPAAR
jgi:tetratricopeptide (TPR) repeat protein/tRNA A-37 threonylcarbamoyl transferase component Bud32